MALGHRFNCPRNLACIASHAADGGPGGRHGGFLSEGFCQCSFNSIGCEGLVFHHAEQARHRGDGAGLFIQGQFVDGDGQGFSRFIDSVEGQQDLQDIAAGFNCRGDFPFPGLRCLQCRLAGSGLQGHVHRTLEQGRVAGFAGSVQHDGKTASGRALPRVQFSQQNLVEKGRVQRRRFGRRLCFGGCRLRPSTDGERGQDGKSEPEFHAGHHNPATFLTSAAEANGHLFAGPLHARTPGS